MILGFAVLIFIRILYIQVAQGDYWAKRAEQNGLQYRDIRAHRGNIIADDGTLLATSLPQYRLAIDPMVAPDSLFNRQVDTLVANLASFFGERSAAEWAAELRKAKAEKKRYKILARRLVDYQEKQLIEQWPLAREKRRGGFIFELTEKRVLPYDELARRTLGGIAYDTAKGLVGRGLEYSFQHILGGKDGQAIFQKVAGGHWKPVNDGSYIRPEDGYDIQTTLNVDLQMASDNALREALVASDADYGSVILMEVATGQIKAMVNLTRQSPGVYWEDNNYAVGNAGLAEPGSTFKIATFAALLEESNGMSLTDTVETGNGKYRFYEDAVMTDTREGGHGRINVQRVFEQSSNIGTSKLVFKYFRREPQKFIQYLDNFGLTKRIDFQMAGEGTPVVKRPGDATWSGASLPWMSVGYEMKLSPLHTLTFCNALANGGKMIQPYIVQRVLEADKPLREFAPRVLNERVCSDRTLTLMRSLMEGVVERGTASNIRTPHYKIAGKTGTSEKVVNGAYTEKHYTSFVGYFPADAPMYSCIVVIDNPRAMRYGALAAAPVFRQIADFAYSQKITRPVRRQAEFAYQAPRIRAARHTDLGIIGRQLGLRVEPEGNEDVDWGWVRGTVKGDTVQLVQNKMDLASVPNVVGMTIRDALYVLENRGMKVVFAGKGKVQQQSVRPGARLFKGGWIMLTLG
ncbi:MAG: transpeptidase family protein [Bernardetiaceae bacterium]|jgi:cell division protein FtsI (penicillin-binding protein 3)|nr:transpeptidase family protein [Bernardetiaceae bacterium]